MTGEGVTVHQGAGIPRVTATLSAFAALAVLTTGIATGHEGMAIALAVGLLIGGGNAYVAERLLEAGISFTLTSMARIVALTALALLAGLVLGFHRVYLIVAGVAISQFILVAVAFSARRQR